VSAIASIKRIAVDAFGETDFACVASTLRPTLKMVLFRADRMCPLRNMNGKLWPSSF